MNSKAPYNPLAEKHHRDIYFLMGLIISLSLSMMAFKWNGPENNISSLPTDKSDVMFMEDPLLPPSPIKKQKAFIPKPPKAQTLVVSDIIIDPDPLPTPADPFTDHDFDLDLDIDVDAGQDIPDQFKLKDQVFTYVDIKPSFGENFSDFDLYIKDNLKYTECARTNRVEGTVKVSFIVEVDGSLTDIKIHEGLGCGINDEVIKILKSCPNWQPGSVNNTPVRVLFGKNINFVMRH
ncbi:MAG: hypothetical protein ACI959_001251 [Limisphaerales bacterium]|jgi:hypothetical protein